MFISAAFKFLFLFTGFPFLFTFAHANVNELDDVNIHELQCEPLFVSLGSSCEPAHMLRFCGIRKAAFPFDWIVSFDGDKLIEILESDFQDFLNENYLVAYERGGALLHTTYHLEFLHDGDWRGAQYEPNMLKLKPKYQRRIERFRELKNYPGTVFFMRAAYLHSANDPHRFFLSETNLEITQEYAIRLNNALKKYFPKLNYKLIITNIHKENKIRLDSKVTDNVFIFRTNPWLDVPVQTEVYREFFNQLLLEESLKAESP